MSLSLGSPSSTTGISWTDGVDNKIDVLVLPSVAPVGFDMYTTAQGTAVRFIGSGLGNGDTGNFLIPLAFQYPSAQVRGFVSLRLRRDRILRRYLQMPQILIT